jgi:hypothetical protein
MKTNVLKLLSALVVLRAALPLIAESTSSSQPDADFPRAVQFEIGSADFPPGDSITIKELRGDSDEIHPGGIYCVSGTYTLSSQDEADLAFYATTTNRVSTPTDPKQIVHITKGTGTFRLIKKMTDHGYLHVTFYSRATGHGFGGVYFGQGQWVLREKNFSYRHEAMRASAADSHESVSATGPNRVLFNYLGNPVVPPADMDAAYTKEGLTRAMQSAAQNAGVSLVKLEIDDSEFPFLIGLVFAEKGDKEKFMAQIGGMKAYARSGGVGGEMSYAMNLVPHHAFPSDTSERIYHRMMLREAVLCDKISARQ